MHILVTEAHFGDSDRLVALLCDTDARVSRCHDLVGECRVLSPGGRCPLDDLTDPAQIVVDVRGAGEDLTAREYGVVCAVRDRRSVWLLSVDPQVPVVVPAGLRDLAIVGTEDDVVEVCRGTHMIDTRTDGRPSPSPRSPSSPAR